MSRVLKLRWFLGREVRWARSFFEREKKRRLVETGVTASERASETSVC